MHDSRKEQKGYESGQDTGREGAQEPNREGVQGRPLGTCHLRSEQRLGWREGRSRQRRGL